MKSYRINGSPSPGPDYKCSKCRAAGMRLWRQTHTMQGNILLLCASCATVDQKDEIARYAHFHQEHQSTIGDLVPARPTPDGETFWGHTSGDVEWWYALPQLADPVAEALLVRRERDFYLAAHQESLAEWLELRQQLAKARGEIRRLNGGTP